ncbi:hypothetical protein AB685_24635 [Bacillus sp. LL01]|uniref:4'-phosphopantetheinyl transferase superfamily protein n=1 Tax=Bacillus sp. LL01 TaxID=1665556 RepID=UPI00064D02BA|nr:4'-phosphopantetheinyl transferase superfamily protein [Bacillus sp. LL01]KMJ55942.1 hypothetical protein AB685_24635 [Bacillus sp. LL01]
MKVFGLGVDIVDRERVERLTCKGSITCFIEKWLSTDERKYLETTTNKVELFSIIFSIKEAFIKASSGHVKLKDIKKIRVVMSEGAYSVSYDDFLKNKHCWITTNVFPNYTISSVTIVII